MVKKQKVIFMNMKLAETKNIATSKFTTNM